MNDYQLVARKRDWVPGWLWRLACIGDLVTHAPLRRWFTEAVPYEQHGVTWVDR